MKITMIIACCFILSTVTLNSACAENKISGLLKEINDTVMQADSIVIAKLRIVSADSVKKNRFLNNTIAGYPIIGKLSRIEKAKSQNVIAIILNAEHYANLLQRCKNKSMFGIRFHKGQNVAEFVYSQPCMQVIWLANINGKTSSAAAVLGPDYRKAILKTFKN
jgi:hypothetical protein